MNNIIKNGFLPTSYIDVTKDFEKYILSDTKSKKKFEQQIRAELRNEYPEMNSDDLDQYVNLIVSQS